MPNASSSSSSKSNPMDDNAAAAAAEVVPSSSSSSSSCSSSSSSSTSTTTATAITLVYANMLGSATAGIIARICTHPLDTAKARVQANSNSHSVAGISSTVAKKKNAMIYRGPLDVLLKTARTEGLSGLYRGFGAVVVGGTPGTVLYLTSYDWAKQQLAQITSASSTTTTTMQSSKAQDFAIHFSAGMFAEAVACVIYVPVDVVKERLQVQHHQRVSITTATTGQQSTATPPTTTPQYYKSSWHAVQSMWRTEGLASLYKGYGATLLSFGTYSGLFFVLYEQLVEQLQHYHHLSTRDEVPFAGTLFCSCTAGAAASWITSPLDMAKLRLQIQRQRQQSTTTTTQQPHNTKVLYQTVWDCLVHAYRHEGGVKGLFRGAWARVLHFAPATTVTITSYEMCRSWFAKALLPAAAAGGDG